MTDTVDPQQVLTLADQAWQAIAHGQYWVLGAVVPIVLTAMLHAHALDRYPRLGAFLATPFGGALVAALGCCTLTVTHAAATGHLVSDAHAVILTAAKSGALSVVGWWLKQRTPAPSQASIPLPSTTSITPPPA